MRTYVRTLPDFTTAVQSGNETTQKSNIDNYVSTSAENGPAMAGPAGPVLAPMPSKVAFSKFEFALVPFLCSIGMDDVSRFRHLMAFQKSLELVSVCGKTHFWPL